MLKEILSCAGLDPKVSANLLGISPRIFGDWVLGRRPIPESIADRIAAVLGVQSSALLTPQRHARTHQADITPAIWFMLRGENLVDADRECILLIRQLGYFINELEEVTKRQAVGWQSLFEDIRRKTDTQAPPREQGRQAARMFRASRGLDQGSNGIGEVFRANLRSMGALVIESPLPESRLEGCSFYIGSFQPDRPCVFANTHHGTWFRRNLVLLHEVAHAIFDVKSAGASLDFLNAMDTNDLAEQRAEAFAQEALIPCEVLRHIAQARGIGWHSMKPRDLAILVAETYVEQGIVLAAAVEADFIPQDLAKDYLKLDINSELREITDHALTAEEFIKTSGRDTAPQWVGKRTTTVTSRPLRLPVHYVNLVLDAFNDGMISRSKAAELLMIDESDFDRRFKPQLDLDE